MSCKGQRLKGLFVLSNCLVDNKKQTNKLRMWRNTKNNIKNLSEKKTKQFIDEGGDD